MQLGRACFVTSHVDDVNIVTTSYYVPVSAVLQQTVCCHLRCVDCMYFLCTQTRTVGGYACLILSSTSSQMFLSVLVCFSLSCYPWGLLRGDWNHNVSWQCMLAPHTLRYMCMLWHTNVFDSCSGCLQLSVFPLGMLCFTMYACLLVVYTYTHRYIAVATVLVCGLGTTGGVCIFFAGLLPQEFPITT
jgi:hypothetical protein